MILVLHLYKFEIKKRKYKIKKAIENIYDFEHHWISFYLFLVADETFLNSWTQ